MPMSQYTSNTLSGLDSFPSFPSQGRAILCVILTAVAIAGVSAILLASAGNMMAAIAFLAGFAILILTMYRVEWGFYMMLGIVLLCDQFDIPGFLPWTMDLQYLKNLKETPFFPNVGAAVLTPMELHLILLVAIWFFVMIAKRERPATYVQAWPAAAFFFTGLCASFVYGIQTGGDFLPALWEVRALFYLGFLMFFVPQIITRREQVETIFWVIITLVTFKALQGAYRFIGQGFTFDGKETLTNHEDPAFDLVLFMFLLALVLFNARTKQLPVLITLLFPLFMGFYAGQRRSVYAAIVPAFACLVALLPRKAKWSLFKVSAPVIFLLILYTIAFWNGSGQIASPARLIRSGLSNDREAAGDHYNSNLYRELEKFDLAITFRHSPVFGIGFGHQYEEPLWLVPIPFPLRDYIPHDEILWLLVKTGGVGFVLFWFFVNAVGFRGASICNSLKDPYLKSVAAAAVCAIIIQVVVSNFDLQLTYYRNMVFLGTMIGLLSALPGMEPRGNENTVAETEYVHV